MAKLTITPGARPFTLNWHDGGRLQIDLAFPDLGPGWFELAVAPQAAGLDAPDEAISRFYTDSAAFDLGDAEVAKLREAETFFANLWFFPSSRAPDREPDHLRGGTMRRIEAVRPVPSRPVSLPQGSSLVVSAEGARVTSGPSYVTS